MTWDDAVAKFFPGLDFSDLVELLVRKGWNDKFAQGEALQIGRLGFEGKTPYDTIEENIKAYGVCTTKVIQTVREDGVTTLRLKP